MRELKGPREREREGEKKERERDGRRRGPRKKGQESRENEKKQKFLDGRHKIQTPEIEPGQQRAAPRIFLLNIKMIPSWVGRATDQSRDKRIGPLSSSPSLS